MSFAKRITGLLLAAIMLLVPLVSVFAEGVGGFAAEGNGYVYLTLPSSGGSILFRVPSGGGALEQIESSQLIEDLVFKNGNLYYIRKFNDTYQIVRQDAYGSSMVHSEFALEPGQAVSHLSWYEDALYALVGGKITIIDPENGDSVALSDTLMTEYVISGGVIYYVSAEDIASYEIVYEGQTISNSAGRLYSMSITGSNAEKLLENGVSGLVAQGGSLYFHNLADGYPMGDKDSASLMGYIHRYNIETFQLSSMNIGYDWGFYGTENGLVVYRMNDVSLFPLEGGTARQLMVPELYASITCVGNDAFVYEQTNKTLTRIPTDGGFAVQLIGGASVVDDTGAIVDEYDPFVVSATDDWGDETADAKVSTQTPASTSSPSSTSKATDSSYFFKNSSKTKLTRKQILAIDKKWWPYARNEIYARHGYVFKTKKYADYFKKKSWYKAGGFSTKDLNSIEWYNMDLLKSMEDEYASGSSGSSSSGTDSSYLLSKSSTKKLTRADVEKLDKKWWPYARNEIYARHGYVFKTKKYADYFKKKSWYKAGGFSTSDLSDIEWYNMELIQDMENGN